MSILKRTCFYSQTSRDVVRFEDWASVITTLGQMAEPHIAGMRGIALTGDDITDYSEVDEISRVDTLQPMNGHRSQHLLGMESTVYDPNDTTNKNGIVHGGRMIPRTDRDGG